MLSVLCIFDLLWGEFWKDSYQVKVADVSQLPVEIARCFF